MKFLVLISKSFGALAAHFQELKIENLGFLAIITMVIQYVTNTWQINVILLFLLVVMIAINTWSGARLAKKEKRYELNVMKELLVSKLIGYFILIIAVSTVVVFMFVLTLKDGITLIPEYYLNILLMLTFVVLCFFEFNSILENLKKYGSMVPKFLTKLNERVVNKIDDITK